MWQWIATIVNVVRAGQRLESTEPLTVSRSDCRQLVVFLKVDSQVTRELFSGLLE